MKIRIKRSILIGLFILFATHILSQKQTWINNIGMEFVLIKPGSMVVGKFQPTVGKPDQGVPGEMYEKAVKMARKAAIPGFIVQIKQPFYMGKFEVTQQQWTKVMGNNPSVFKSDTSRNHPVENIAWKDAQKFIKKLNAMDKIYIYRLPTEFEWEYAARAGAPDDIPWKEIQISAVLSGIAPANIGTKKPNVWGIYDMLGNVWEWVLDYYNEKIFADTIPPRSGKEHVLKGASFTGDVKNATYLTHAAGPGNGFDIGFRLVRELRPIRKIR